MVTIQLPHAPLCTVSVSVLPENGSFTQCGKPGVIFQINPESNDTFVSFLLRNDELGALGCSPSNILVHKICRFLCISPPADEGGKGREERAPPIK